MVNQGGVDPVEESAADVAGDADQQADQGIGEGETSPDADHSERDGEGGEAVGAGMDAVGDEGGGSDPAAGPDSVERDEYVACEPDEAGRQDPAEPGKWLGSKEMADGFVTGEDRG